MTSTYLPYLQQIYTQNKDLSPLCLFWTCLFRQLAVVAVYLHWEQGYFTPLCLFTTCILRSFAVVAEYSHLEQGYLTSSCLILTCPCRLLLVFAQYSHWEHGYLSCLLLLPLLFYSRGYLRFLDIHFFFHNLGHSIAILSEK